MVLPVNDIQQDIEDKENKEIFNESLAQIDRAIHFERKYLENEGIDLPNENVKNSTVFLLYKLASEGIHPVKITTTVEEGLYLIFNNYPYILYLEIYNNGDIGYIIEDVRYNKLVEMKDMYSILEVKNRISQFYW